MKEKIISGLIILPIYLVIFMILSMFNIYLFEGPWYISIPIIAIFPLIGIIISIINYKERINYRTLFMMIFFFIMALICYYRAYTPTDDYSGGLESLGYFCSIFIFAILYQITTVVFCYKLFKNNIIYPVIIYLFIALIVIIMPMIYC